MKNIFTKTLTLIAFLSLSIGVWGEDKSLPNDGTLSFEWSSKTSGNMLGWAWSDGRLISDGLWQWNKEGDNNLKWSDKFGGKYNLFKGSGTYNAQTRDRYYFEANTYTFTFYYCFEESDCQYYEPEIMLNATDNFGTIYDPTGSYVNGHTTGAYTKEVEVTVPSAGYYYIRFITGQYNGKDERFGYQKVVIAKAGPTAMKRIYMPKTTFDDWTAASAKFAVYRITDSKWQDHYMTSGTGCLVDYYYDDIPETCEKVIIGRFNPSSNPPFGWGDSDNKPWNQTVDVTLGSNNCVAPKNDKDGNNYKCDLSTFTPPTYAVTYAAGDHGTGEMTDNNSPYACGSDVTVLENEFEAVRGYVFNNFSDGSKTYDAGDVISDLQANKTLTAQWTALTSYTITASANPSHKGYVTGAGTYYEGEKITLTAVSEDANKYMFDDWSDGDKSNPRVFTAQSGIAPNYVANFISGKKECANTLTIQCETDYVLPEGKSINDGWFFVPAEGGEHSEYTGSHPTDTKGYVDFKGNGGTMYYPMQIGETATISYDVWICNTDNPKLYVYSSVATSGSSNITYGGKTYYQIENHEIPQVGKPFGHQVIAGSNTLQPGDYIIALGANGWTVIDQIVLTSSPAAFCTITPAAKCTISYAMNGHGTAIGDVLIEEGETWTAPTPDPTEYGWKFDGWKRPSSTEDETLYKSGSTGFTVSGNETLTAQWSEDLSTAYFMKGTFKDDFQTQYDFVKKTGESTGNIAYVTVNNLSAGTDYWFMVYKSPSGSWGQTSKDGKMTADNNTWTLNGGNNVGMTTTAKGSYTFQIDFKNVDPQIHIEYPAAYTITFDKGNNSATGTMNNMVNIAENEEVTLTTNSYALGCNHFVKWKDQDNNEYEDGAQVTVTKNLTLTAQWAINRYKAIYDANGVSGYTGDLPATVEYDCGAQVTISQTPKLSKFGYTFIGWNTDPNATVALADNYQFTIDQGDTKIYAIWNVKKPTGLSIAPETGTYQVTKGTGVQMIVTLTPDASELAEENREVTWSTSNSTFATVNQSGYVNFVGQGSVTITATSKLDGSVSNTYNFVVDAGSCNGWEISAYDKNDKGESSNETMDYFYQVGSTNEWRVKYVLPNGTRKFWVGPCKFDSYSKEWEFGWIRLKDRRDNGCGNNTQYAGQNAVGELVIWSNSTDEGQNYGIAFLPNYKISYMTDGSNWRIMDFHSTSTQYSYETDIFQVPEGYKSNGNMKYFVGVEKNTGENMMVEQISQQDAMNGVNGLKDADMAGKYGKWHISSNSCDRNWYCQFTRYYQVRFEMNGGDGNIDPMYFVGDNSQSFNTSTLTNPTRTGYELTGWKDQEDHTYTTSQSITVTKDLVLTAQWTAKDYAITLNKNNGSSDGSASAKYDSNTLNSISHVGNRTGYSLAGYFTLAENGSQVITAEGALVASAPDYTDENRNWKKASNCTLYAQWTANKYTVNLDFDGGAGGKSSIEVTYDAAMPAVAPLPTREFYDFAGYYTEKNGQGTQYYTANGISAHVWDITTDNTTLYAYWTPKSYAITWNFDGGQATGDDYTKGDVPYGTTIKAPTVEKAGYNFAGWNPAVGTMPGAPATYTAQWTAKTYTLTLDANGGSVNGSVTVTYNSGETTDFSAPTRDNYVIEGFYAENGCTTKVLNADGTLCTSVENYTDASGNWKNTTCTTLYTKWTEKPKVDALIVTPDNESYMSGQGGSATMSCSKEDDSYFTGHKVLKFTFSNMNDHWNGYEIGKDKAYNSSSSAGATGFGFWYKTEGDFTLAFCFDYNDNNGDQLKCTLPSTNNTWKYMYVANNAANGWNKNHIRIYVNGTDNAQNWPGQYGKTVTSVNSGTFYITEITATEITEKFINHTVTFTQPSHGSTSAQIVDGETITSGTEVPEGTDVIFTWNEVSGYDFVKFNDGTTDYTQNPCTLTVNRDLTVTTTVEVEVPKHLLTVIAGENGSVSPTSQEVGENREVTITATPENHYGFASWTATGITLTPEQEKQNPLTITMPTNDVTLTASFEHVYVDNMIATGNNSSTPTSNGSATMSAESVVDANNFFNHNVLQFTYSGMKASGDYRGVEITRDANYQQSSSVGATGFGFYYKTAAGQTITFCFDYGDGNNQKKTELPSTNGFWKYAYVNGSAANGWNNETVIIYVNGTGGRNGDWTPSSLNVSSATTTPNEGTFYIAEICATERTTKPEETPVYTATFAANPSDKATVTATVDDAAIASGATVDAGKSITFNYSNVDANYRFTGWTATGISLTDAQKQEHPLTLKMPSASITLTANFVRVYTLTINDDGNGSATVSPEKDAYAAGESITVTSQPTAGYAFNYYMDGENKIETDPYEFTMSNSDRTISVNFKKSINYYDINTGVSGEGTVTIKVNGETHTGQQILEGTQVTLTATPNDESHGFTQWQDGNTDNPRTITANAANAAITWTATFAIRHTVTATFGKPGISVTGGGEYPTGAEVTLTANWTPASKDFTYGFKEWTDLDGVNLSDEQKVSNPLTFSMPSANVSMKATFAPVECTNTKTIQCETDGTYIKFIEQGEDLSKYPSEIPHSANCGPFSDYYKGWHGTGYYDFKEATNTEMYYPVELPASTYKFEVWSASNGDKDCYMNLYIESDDASSEVVYKGVKYKKTNYVTANNNCGEGGSFKLSGTINGIVLNSPKSVIVGLHCNQDFGSFDQIVITATDAVFCEEKSIETFTIAADESKEIPVSGVKNLVVYEGGQATNEDDVEVFETVKYIRSITADNIDQWSTFAVPYTATKTQVSKDGVDDIYPVWRMENGTEQAGYYFMEVLTDKNEDAIGEASRARWDMSYTRQPQKDSAYITMFPSSQSGGYFIGSEIFYIGDYKSSGGVTLTGSNNAFIEHGGWPEEGKPKYYYFPNSAITAIQPYDAYVLSEDGTEFVLTDHPTILPFQCYIQATTEFKHLYPRLVMRQNGGGTTDLIPVTADGWKVSGVDKVMIDEVIYVVREGKIYTVMGQLVK